MSRRGVWAATAADGLSSPVSAAAAWTGCLAACSAAGAAAASVAARIKGSGRSPRCSLVAGAATGCAGAGVAGVSQCSSIKTEAGCGSAAGCRWLQAQSARLCASKTSKPPAQVRTAGRTCGLMDGVGRFKARMLTQGCQAARRAHAQARVGVAAAGLQSGRSCRPWPGAWHALQCRHEQRDFRLAGPGRPLFPRAQVHGRAGAEPGAVAAGGRSGLAGARPWRLAPVSLRAGVRRATRAPGRTLRQRRPALGAERGRGAAARPRSRLERPRPGCLDRAPARR